MADEHSIYKIVIKIAQNIIALGIVFFASSTSPAKAAVTSAPVKPNITEDSNAKLAILLKSGIMP